MTTHTGSQTFVGRSTVTSFCAKYIKKHEGRTFFSIVIGECNFCYSPQSSGSPLYDPRRCTGSGVLPPLAMWLMQGELNTFQFLSAVIPDNTQHGSHIKTRNTEVQYGSLCVLTRKIFIPTTLNNKVYEVQTAYCKHCE
jgi:hypothetical protein